MRGISQTFKSKDKSSSHSTLPSLDTSFSTVFWLSHRDFPPWNTPARTPTWNVREALQQGFLVKGSVHFSHTKIFRFFSNCYISPSSMMSHQAIDPLTQMFGQITHDHVFRVNMLYTWEECRHIFPPTEMPLLELSNRKHRNACRNFCEVTLVGLEQVLRLAWGFEQNMFHEMSFIFYKIYRKQLPPQT